MVNIGEKLKELRKERKLTLDMLVADLNQSYPDILEFLAYTTGHFNDYQNRHKKTPPHLLTGERACVG